MFIASEVHLSVYNVAKPFLERLDDQRITHRILILDILGF